MDRAVLIGGSTPVDAGHRYFDEVWSWDGERWVSEPPLPFRRSSHRAVYDSRRRTLLLFGGGFGRAMRSEGVVWERRDEGWKAVGGDRHAGRSEPGMCHDPTRDRTVIFGGWDVAGDYRGDTWEWDGRILTRVDSVGAPGARPSPRSGHAFLFDPVRKRCLLFGGRGPDGYGADTWEWDGVAWRELQVDGPSPRWFFGSAADPDRGRVVVFGGRGPEGDLGDTWSWDGTTWRRLPADGPLPRSMAKLAWSGRAVVLFGGRRDTPGGFRDMNDTWELEDGEWVER